MARAVRTAEPRPGPDPGNRPDSRPRLRAAGLALPLVVFIGVTFVAPLATMLVRSVYDPVVADALPETLERLRNWDGAAAPGEAVSRRRRGRFWRREKPAGSAAWPAASTAFAAGCAACWSARRDGSGRSTAAPGARR